MSTQRNDIVMISQKFDYETFNKWSYEEQEEFERDWIEHPVHSFDKYHCEPKNKVQYWDGSLQCVFDGMNGEYIHIGIILSASKAESWDGLPYMEYETHQVDKLKYAVMSQLEAKGLPQHFNVPTDVKLHIFSHFS